MTHRLPALSEEPGGAVAFPRFLPGAAGTRSATSTAPNVIGQSESHS